MDEIDLQILTNEGQLLTHQKERGEHTWHLKELKQRWRKQSAQDTPASIPQAKPQTPAGATVNSTGQAMPEARDTASKAQTTAGAMVNILPLFFTYNKQSLTLTLTNNHSNPMKLSKQRAKLFNLLKKPKDIRLILRNLYSKQIEKNQKITDNKRNPYDSFASKFNEDWRDHFKLNEELRLIQCENEIVSIVHKIDWK